MIVSTTETIPGYKIVDLREGKMQDAYARHVEKRISKLRKRMRDSKLHSTRKFKY